MHKSSAFLSAFLLLVTTSAFSQKRTTVAYKDTVVTNFFQRTTGLIAGDGGFTVHLSDGRSLWTFGDSYIDTYDPKTKTVPCLFQVNNTALLQPGNDWNREHTSTIIGDDASSKTLFKHSVKGDFFWPVAGIQLSDTVYIFCSGIKLTGAGGVLGFDYSGQNVLNKMKFPEMKVVGYKVLPDFKGIHYGIGFIKDDKSSYTYVYGLKNTQKNNDLYVARFPTNNPNTLWECWNGSTWTNDMSQAAQIKKSVGSTPYLIKLKNKILLVSSEFSMGCDQGKNIYASTSTNITGPFSSLKSIYTINDTLNGHYPFFYVPVAHPQFINNKNELLVTYCINGYGTCVPTCVNGRMDPNRYRLRGVRVPLKLIDPTL